MHKLLLVLLLCVSVASRADELGLVDKMQVLDAAVFDAFNKCADPLELDKHASYFAEDVEFYHDTGGVTWDRDTMLANTKKYACGNYTRERVAGTFEAYPIKDFGVITKGVHVFCQNSTKQCDGKAQFVMIWHDTGSKLAITRVLSFGHQVND